MLGKFAGKDQADAEKGQIVSTYVLLFNLRGLDLSGGNS